MRHCFLALLFMGLLSCGPTPEEKAYEEIQSIFAKGLAEADFNFQISDDRRFIDEFNAIGEEDLDSLRLYAVAFRELVQANFHFDNNKSLSDLLQEKEKFDSLNEKFIALGFDGICEVKKQYDDMGMSPGAKYHDWLKSNSLERDEFERDMYIINVEFGKVCRTKQYKEHEKGRYFD